MNLRMTIKCIYKIEIIKRGDRPSGRPPLMLWKACNYSE